jgi:radical SAM-linked protein
MLGDKLRFRFVKTGTLRLLSHHDLMRCTERMLRRAGLPFKSTAGFHPTPRVVFALSLPLGVEGLDEVVEMEFTRELDSEAVFEQLNAQAPPGLRFTRVSVVPLKATAMPRRVAYRLPLPSGRTDSAAARSAELMAESKVWVDRLKPNPKQLNIRPYLRGLRIEHVSPSLGEGVGEGSFLLLDLWVTKTGTARADELLKLLDLADLPDAGAVVARTTVEVHDEAPNPDPADVPPVGPAEILPLEPAALAALNRRDDEEEPAAAGWGASPAGPVVE